MGHVAGHRPSEASLGEQQRGAIARALVLAPAALILDEPTAHQDAHATGSSARRGVAAFEGAAVLVATHDALGRWHVAARRLAHVGRRPGGIATAGGAHYGGAMAMVTSFVLINAQPNRTAALAEALADLDDVAEVYSVAGDFDLVAIVRVRHHDDLADVVTKHIAALDGIVRTHTLVAFRAYSRRDLDAMWAIGAEQ